MPQAAADAISKFLDSFNPKTFGSDAQAQSWIHNESRKNRLGTNQGSAITNFVKGFSNVNANLRAGKADPQAAQMLKGAEPLPSDLILSKTVEPSAFGLDPNNIANVEELTGKLIHDPGFTSANIGTPNPPSGPGPHIQMTIATPAGTKAIVPQVSSPTSEIMLTPDQNLRVTKVTPDGKGGYYMMAVATPGGTPKEKSTPLHEAPPAPAPLNLPAKPGEIPAAPATPGSAPESGPSAPSAAPSAAPAAAQAPTQSGPASPVSAPRTEPNVVEALTPGGTKAPAAQPGATSGVPQAPAVPEVPAGPVDFRQAVKDANIPSPTEGPRRKQWNSAYLGVVSGKKHPQDALRELRTDIEHNKGTLADDIKTNTDSGPLPNDIKAQEALANLIEEKFNLGAPKAAETPASEVPKKATPRRGPKVISKEEMPNKAEIRRESRARTPAPTAKQVKVSEEAKASAARFNEEAQAKNAATDEAAKKVADVWLEKAGVKDSDLSDHERTGVTLMANDVARKKISRPEAARRLRQPGKNGNLTRIADAIIARPSPHAPAAKVAKKAAPTPSPEAPSVPTNPDVHEALSKKTIPELRRIASDANMPVPARVRTKAAVVKYLADTAREHDSRSGGEKAQKNLLKLAGTPAVKAEAPKGEGVSGAIPDNATIAQLRQIAKERGVRIPSKLTRKDDIRAHLEGGNATPTEPKASTADRLTTHLLDKLRPDVKESVLKDMSPAERKAVDDAVSRVKGAEVGIKTAGTGGEIPEKATVVDLRRIARERNVKIPSKITRKDDIRKFLEGAGPENAAVSRQANIDKARNIADIAGELDHLLDNDASPAAMESRVAAWAKRTNAPGADVSKLMAAVRSGDKSKIDSELTRLRTENKLGLPGGRRGETVSFNPKLHEAPGGGVKAGEKVRVGRTGHEATLPGGEKVNVGKAVVEPVGAGKGEIPKGADIETAIGHLDPKVVRDRKAILDTVRQDLAEDKKSPAQVGRELDRAVSAIENSAAIRFGGHIGNPSDERKVELRKQLDQQRHEAAELKRLATHLKTSRRAREPKLSTETVPAKKAAPAAGKTMDALKAYSTNTRVKKSVEADPTPQNMLAGAVEHDQAADYFRTQIRMAKERGDARRKVLDSKGRPSAADLKKNEDETAAAIKGFTTQEESHRQAAQSLRDRAAQGGATTTRASKKIEATKAVAKIEAPEELKKAVARTTIADLRKQAEAENIKVPASARTKQQVVDHIATEMAKRELARRGVERATGKGSSPEASAVVKDDIRKAYSAVLAKQNKKKGDFIGLADLRDELGDKHSREEVDKALVDFGLRGQTEGARVIPVANRKALQRRDREAAVKIGIDEPSHAITFKNIGPEAPAPAKAAKATKVAKKVEPEAKAPSARSIASRRLAERAQAEATKGAAKKLSASEQEDVVRNAYNRIARRPGLSVGLADLRDELTKEGLSREEQDATLLRMNRSDAGALEPQSNQKILNKRDWDAAVEIGGQKKHLFTIVPNRKATRDHSTEEDRRLSGKSGIQAGKFSDKDILKNHWGEFGRGEVGFHPDSAVGKALRYMGEDRKLDVDGEPLANVAGRIATDGVRGKKSSQEVIDELKTLTERLPEGSKARSELTNAIKEMDAPKRTVSLPSGTPKPLADLARKFEQIPLARRTHDATGREERITSELTLLAQIADKWSKGQLSGFRLLQEVRGLRNHRHESQEGKLELDRAIDQAIKEIETIGFRNLNPPSKKEE
jgi:hypothetical protein